MHTGQHGVVLVITGVTGSLELVMDLFHGTSRVQGRPSGFQVLWNNFLPWLDLEL